MSAYTPNMGPVPVYWELEGEKEPLSPRDRLSVAIKSISLMMGALHESDDRRQLEDVAYFGVLPFADFRITAMNFFTYALPENSRPLPLVFSVLFHESRRGFVFDHTTALQGVMKEAGLAIKREVEKTNGKPREEVLHEAFSSARKALSEIHKLVGSSGDTLKRRIKLVFSGLDNSGKTSFLLALQRKYSKLMGVKVTRGASRERVELLGTEIYQWDLGGQKKFREKYHAKSDEYFGNADLVLFFIDSVDEERHVSAVDYLERVLSELQQHGNFAPVVVCLSKSDPDLREQKAHQERIQKLQRLVDGVVKNTPNRTHVTVETSIFDPASLLSCFSRGLALLSPNRTLVDRQLEWLASRAGLTSTLLLSNNGLVLGEFFDEASTISTEKGMFELVAPQFADLFKKLKEYRLLTGGKVVYELAQGERVCFLHLPTDPPCFLLFHARDPEVDEAVGEQAGTFVERVEPLLHAYLS
ncbi:MAG: hypothetical protein Kow0069_28600 [Promethearchaeota archaeon]